MKTGFGSARSLLLVAALVMAALPTPAPAGVPADYFPLVSGNRWDYGRLLGETATVEVLGAFDVLGQPTTRVRWTETGQTYENFWSLDAQGRVYIHGARNLTFLYGVAYTPPILFLNPPMSLGQSWVTTGVVVTDFDGNNPSAPADFGFGVGFAGPLSVPAGIYQVVGIGQLVPTGTKPEEGEADFDALGALRTGKPGAAGNQIPPPDYWFSDGVGPVQYKPNTADPFRLLRFSGPTPVEATTWSRIKLLAAR